MSEGVMAHQCACRILKISCTTWLIRCRARKQKIGSVHIHSPIFWRKFFQSYPTSPALTQLLTHLAKVLISSGPKKLHFCGSWTCRIGSSIGHEVIEVTVTSCGHSTSGEHFWKALLLPRQASPAKCRAFFAIVLHLELAMTCTDAVKLGKPQGALQANRNMSCFASFSLP